MNLSKLIEQYIAFRKSLGEIQDANACQLRMFVRSIGTDADIADVRAEQVNAFLAGKGQRTLTWHHKLSSLQCFYYYAVSRNYIAAAPLPTVIPRRPPSFIPYIYSHDDLRCLLHAIDSDTLENGSGCRTDARKVLIAVPKDVMSTRSANGSRCSQTQLRRGIRHAYWWAHARIKYG
jgi:site-specific recombinase XerD